MNHCWKYFKLSLTLGAIAALCAGAYIYVRMDEEIRRRIEARIASKYPGLLVHVRSARLLAGEGVEVRGLSIAEPNHDGPHGELLYIDELFLACSTKVEDLAQGEPMFSQIRVRRPVLRAARHADGAWNVACLWPIPKFGKRAPIHVENGVVEIVDSQKTPASSFTLRDINLSFNPQPGDYPQGEPPVEVQGYLTADHVQRIELGARLEPAGRRWAVQGAVHGLDVSPELQAALPSEWTAASKALESVRGQGRIEFQVWGNPAAAQPIVYQVNTELTGGRIDDARLPYPLTDVHLLAKCNNAGFVLDELTARNGPASLRVTGRGEGCSPSSPLELSIEGKHLVLSKQWTDIMPAPLKATWARFSPAGEIDASLRLTFDGHDWRMPQMSVACLDTSFSFEKFPYRLEHGTGTLTLADDKLAARLSFFAGAEPVAIEADLLHPGPHYTGWVHMKGNNIPLDRTLFNAMPERSREALGALNLYGTFNFLLLLTRDHADADELGRHLVATLNRCSVKYDKFPYPIDNIHGTLELIDNSWTFRGLQGFNHTGIVDCSGYLRPAAEGSELQLTFTGQSIQLDSELRDALGPNMQRLWNNVRPHGPVNLRADVAYRTGQKGVGLTLHAEPVGDSVFIEPECIPYRLEKLQGAFDYREGHVDFRQLRAIHDRATIATGGSCDFQPDGGWQMKLSNFTVDRLHADRDLVAALPAKLRKLVADLNPGGAINLRGNVGLSSNGKPDAPLASQWDVSVDMQQGSLNCGCLKLDEIYGGLRLVGESDGAKCASRGELAIDSLIYKDHQLTEIRGPLWIDNEQVLFGTAAEQRAHGRGARRITAKIYGGVLLADASIALQQTPKFSLQAVLNDGDLATMASEYSSGKQKLKGKVLATVDLKGTAAGTHTLSGRGSIRLRDADIYQLPVMVALLKILSVRTPDSTAFISSDIDYRIDGEHLYFDRIVLSGDAISLVGKGEMGLDREIKLAFHTQVGRPEFQLPAINKVLGQASKQIMLIHVTGTLSNPKTRNEVLPSLQAALQALQNDIPGAGLAPLPPVAAGAGGSGAAAPKR